MNHRNLIADTAELRDVALESLTDEGMVQMSDLLDQIERSVRAAMITPAIAPA